MGKLYIGNSGSTPAIVKVEEVPKKKFGVSIDNILPNNENGVGMPSTELFNIDLSWLIEIGEVYVTMPDGTTKAATDEWSYKFYNNYLLTGTIDLSNLCCRTTRSRFDIFNYAFYGTSITKVILPQKEQTSTSSTSVRFSNTFTSCNYLKEIVLPPRIGPDYTLNLESSFQRLKLSDGIVNFDVVEVLQDLGMHSTFRYSELPEEIRFTSLREISDNPSGYAFGATFSNCTGCKRFYFPVLTIAEAKSFGTSSTALTWYGNKDVEEIHFRADMQSTIEEMIGYDTKFGATNATIYFDL
jgi:hypothetical protein